MNIIKKYLMFCLAILIFTKCSSDEPTIVKPVTDRYKLSFEVNSGIGEKHFKVKYYIEDKDSIVVNYDIYNTSITTIKDSITFDTHPNNIDFSLVMKETGTYLHQIKFKAEDLKENVTIRNYNDDDWYIMPTDLLTEKEFLNNLYNEHPNYFTSRHLKPNFFEPNYFYAFYSTNNSARRPGYHYENDVLKHKNTRGSLRIVIDNHFQNSSYNINVPNGWVIKELNGFTWLSSDTSINGSSDKTVEYILPGHLDNISVILKGDNTKATIYLMRKDGTVETVDIHSNNNEIITTNFEI